MLKIGEFKNFTVVSFTPDAIRGGVFRMQSGRWHWLRAAERKITDAGESAATWCELWKELRGGDELIVLTGVIPGGTFFCLDVISLPPREQREALLMELPRQTLRTPAAPVCQFCPVTEPGIEGLQTLNVYAFEQKRLDAATTPLRREHLRADELVHPLIGVSPEEPAVFIPEIDPGFYFQNGKFHHVCGAEEMLETAGTQWRTVMERKFVQDVENANFKAYFPLLLTARLIASGKYRRHRDGLRILPDELHPVRFRRQLHLTAALSIALVLLWLWNIGRERWRDFQAYRDIVSQTRELKQGADSMQSSLRRALREQRDIGKVISSNFGEGDIIGQLAALSKLLPQDVMVSDLRWSESGIDLVLQSESDNLDLPRILKPLSRWKVADIQQRQGRFSSTTTVSAKLIPAEPAPKKTKGARK